MASNADIYRSAAVLIQQYGKRAYYIAGEHVLELEKDGKKEFATTWREVMNATKELLRENPRDGEPTH